jgi:hypothetical protein
MNKKQVNAVSEGAVSAPGDSSCTIQTQISLA